MPTYVVRANVGSTVPVARTNKRKLCRDSNGRLWAHFRLDGGVASRIYVAYSDDGGVTWNEEHVSVGAGAGQQLNASIAVDDLNNLHVIWSGQTWGANPGWDNIQYKRRSAAGVWDAQVGLTDMATASTIPVLAIDSLNRVHAAWQGWGYLPIVGQNSIIYQVRSAAGVWGAQEIVVQTAGTQEWGSIAIDSNDVIHLAWEATNQIQYNQRTAAGWGVQEAVTAIGNQEVPIIALDSGNNPIVIWTGNGWGANPGIRNIRYRSRIAGVWGAHEAITDNALEQRWVSCALDANDVVYASWRGSGWGTFPARQTVLLRRRTAGVWGAVELVADKNVNEGHAPSMIWSMYPIVSGLNINIPSDGCALLYASPTPTQQVNYYYPTLVWPSAPPTPSINTIPSVQTLPATGVT